jgi:hypothetical protein
MSRDWARGAHDEFLVDPRLGRVAEAPHAGHGGRAVWPRFSRLPLMCALAGVFMTLLYVWPVLFLADILSGGFRPSLFAWILGGSAAVASLACALVTVLEQRHWSRNRHTLSDFADPPTWT